MRQFVNLQIYEHVTLDQAVVEDEIHVEVVLIESESLLTSLEQEALSHLQQEGLHLVDDGILQFGLRICGIRLQPEKLEGDGILDDVGRLLL